MKLLAPDNSELIDITGLERDGDELIVRGKVFGAMPLVAKLSPAQARAALKMLNPRLCWFLLTLPFRRSRP